MPYLADDCFIPIAEELKNMNQNHIVGYFHAEYYLNCLNHVKDYYSPQNLPSFIQLIPPVDASQSSEKEILKIVKEQIKQVITAFAPDRLVFITDKTYAFRVFELLDKRIPKFVVQPSTRTYETKKVGFKRNLKVFFEKHIKGIPINSSGNSFGLESKESAYLFWTKFWFPPKSIQNSKKLYEIGPLTFQYKFSKLQKKFEVGNSENIILIVLGKRSSIPKTQFEAIEEMVETAITGFGSSHEVIVKVHPREDLDYFVDRFGKYGKAQIIQDANSTALVNKAELILAPWSTLIYEALFLQKKFILLNPNGMFYLNELMVPGFKFIANNQAQLRKMAETVFSDKDKNVDIEFERARKILIGDIKFPAALEAAKLILAS